MRPGVNITSTRSQAEATLASRTGTAFVVTLAEKGPTDAAQELFSPADYRRIYGSRVAYGYGYDAAEFLFALGCPRVVMIRVVGPGADPDTLSILDADDDPAISADAIGEYDSGLFVEIEAGILDAARRVVVVTDSASVELERSPELATLDAMVAWGTGSDYVRIRKTGTLMPKVTARTTLAGGDDDRSNITDTHRIAALANFNGGFGVGQVLVPGSTSTAIHTALLEHAKAFNRFALLDLPDTPTVATLTGAVTTQRAAVDDDEISHGMTLTPWAVTYGDVRNTTRTTPYSIIQAGLIARVDGKTGNPNVPAAGSEGQATTDTGKDIVLELTQTFTDAEHELLNTGGVNVVKMVAGAARTYGYRTLADENDDDYDGYVDASAARCRMAITSDALGGGEEFVFDQITPAKISEWNTYLDGILLGYYNMGALYGDSKQEAYTVDTGAAVNTPSTIQDRQLNAMLSVTYSPFAEQVNINLSRRALPASA